MATLPSLPHGLLDPARPLRVPVGPMDRVRGEGPVTLLVYADFDCPDCQALHRAYHQVDAALRARIRTVHRHFPLISSRPRAMQSALAVEAAQEQDAYWRMYDRLLAAERDRAPGEIDRIVRELGLDEARFRRDLSERRHSDRIWSHMRSGRESGVHATPSLFLQGFFYKPVVTTEAIAADLEAVLAATDSR
jgi:protein-disulfide isomerase